MSKKIIVPLKNIRHYLHDLFHEYLEEQYELEALIEERNYRKNFSMMFGCDEWGWDDEDDEDIQKAMEDGYVFPGADDEYEQVWPPYGGRHKSTRRGGSKKHKNDDDAYSAYWKGQIKKKHKKGGNARVIDINTPYSGDEEDPTEYADYYDLGSDGIEDGKKIYYYPEYNRKSSRLEFNTLSAFSDFCADNGFVVPPYVGDDISYRRESHTCLRPDAREEGLFEIMAEEDYASMVYEAMPVAELSQ